MSDGEMNHLEELEQGSITSNKRNRSRSIVYDVERPDDSNVPIRTPGKSARRGSVNSSFSTPRRNITNEFTEVDNSPISSSSVARSFPAIEDIDRSSQSNTGVMTEAGTQTVRGHDTGIPLDQIVHQRDPDLLPNIRWFKKGDLRNKAIIEDIRNKRYKLYKAMMADKWEKEKFPYAIYGKLHKKRGTPEGIARYGKTYADALPDQKANRKEDGWYGPGMYGNTGYAGRGAFWGRALGGIAGGMLGNRIGMGATGARIGSWLGDKGSDWVEKRFLGRGGYDAMGHNIMSDYTMGNLRHLGSGGAEVNQLMNRAHPSIGMSVHLDETNSVTITHTEFIGDISPTASGFQTQYFLALNPGLSGTFPWLSNIAQFYEEYEFLQLAFTVKSLVTEGNANAKGSVILATQYNPLNPRFTNKQQMENYDYANSAKVTADVHHGIECDPQKRGGSQIEYVRTGAVPSNQDLKTYDLATFQLATNGADGSTTIGELWVSYKVKLSKTKLVLPGAMGKTNTAFAQYTFLSVSSSNFFPVTTNGAGTALTSPTVPIVGGNVPLNNIDIPAFVTLGAANGTVASKTITFPSTLVNGRYIITMAFTCTTQPTDAITLASSNGLAIGTNGSVISSITHSSLASTTFVVVHEIQIANATSNPVSLTYGGLSAIVATSMVLNINQVYNSL